MATNPDAENIKTQMYKGYLEYCILMITNAKSTYSLEIIKDLKESNLILVEGTVYPLLTRMKNKDLLSYSWRESSSGPPRKYYRITPKGKELLDELENTWSGIQQAINAVHDKCTTFEQEERERYMPDNKE